MKVKSILKKNLPGLSLAKNYYSVLNFCKNEYRMGNKNHSCQPLGISLEQGSAHFLLKGQIVNIFGS